MDVLRIPLPFPKNHPSKAQALVNEISTSFRSLPDDRKPGNNRKFSMHDAACSAFSVFLPQQPSFLSFQRDLERTTGRNNVQSLFGVQQVPSDTQIRNMLKSVSPQEVAPLIQHVGNRLKEEGGLEDYRVLSGTLLMPLDGTDIFSSEKIHCPSCHETHWSDGTVLYRHIAVTPAIVAPGEPRVIPLPPEFVTPQDGTEKQDCEIRAALPVAREVGALLRFLEGHDPGRRPLCPPALLSEGPGKWLPLPLYLQELVSRNR